MAQNNLSAKSKFNCNSVSDYLKTYYSDWDVEDDQLMSFLHESYKDLPTGGVLLDIGGGPTIHQHISASAKVDEITFTDYLEPNIEQINLWLQDHPTAYDWDQYFKYTSKLEKQKETISSMKSRLRSKLKSTAQLDILRPPSIINGRSQFDIVSCFFCLEAATFSKKEFQTALTNISSFLKGNGHLFLSFLAETTGYKVEGKTYKAFPVSEKLLKEEMKRLGYQIKSMKIEPSDGRRGYGSSIFLLAQKQ